MEGSFDLVVAEGLDPAEVTLTVSPRRWRFVRRGAEVTAVHHWRGIECTSWGESTRENATHALRTLRDALGDDLS